MGILIGIHSIRGNKKSDIDDIFSINIVLMPVLLES